MKRIILTGFVALCAPIAGALASNWVTVSRSDTGTLIEVDLDSIRSSGGKVKAWTRWSHNTPQEVKHSYPPKTYTSSKDLAVYNCYERSSAVIQSTSYSQSGEVVDSRSGADVPSAYSEVVPDSVGESILDAVCGNTSRRAPTPSPSYVGSGQPIQQNSSFMTAKGWKADWGSGIIAVATKNPCSLKSFLNEGFIYNLDVSLPLSRIKRKSDAWKTVAGRAVTVQGCWYSIDGPHVKVKMNRKRDSKEWEQQLNFEDGSWAELR